VRGLLMAFLVLFIGAGLAVLGQALRQANVQKEVLDALTAKGVTFYRHGWFNELHLKVNFDPVLELYAAETRITDDDLALVARLPDLQALYLSRTQITDKGLAHLAGMSSLQHLALDSTRITDAGIQHLRTLPALKSLCLVDTNLTDEGLPALAEMPALDSVMLDKAPKITDEGIEKFRKRCRRFVRVHR